ncbi:MAG TPA: erythromycin esterase family protein, partial [Pseudoxanthomonas mexicana]|nr:erythromycin esterase family protein [Pseudoxanthomonas mexicana]
MALHTPLAVLRDHAHVLREDPRDYDPLLSMAATRDFVLLGEATHGTHEFYAMRAAITRRLVTEAGFDAVVVEGDWPDVLRLHRYATATGEDSLDQAFQDFERFPAWMWRNRDVHAFIDWLRGHNAGRPHHRQAGFYGMDLYSLYRSADAVVTYL